MAPSPEDIADGRGASSSIQNLPPSDRKLDDEFLLNQTRIWLEKVLNKEFDKDVNLSDLLADGQILFDVYKELRRMLISVNHPSQHKFLEKESVSSTKIAEKFPYAKVADFLQVCKVLGLRDEDLFPSSDVVHKNNTLQVCTCLRSLSISAISWKLPIPEFDSVAVTQRNKSTVNMTTGMAGGESEAGEFVSIESETSSPTADNENESNGDECKPPWKLLKLIAGGAGALVAVGFMLYFLRPRKKGTREKNFILPNPTRSAATEKREEEEQGCCISKFYPAYKLKF